MKEILLLAGSDQAELVDLIGIAAAGKVVDRCVQTLKDRAVCIVAADTLCELMTDICGLEVREDEDVCTACNLGILALDLGNIHGNSSIELQLAVDVKLRSLLLGDNGSIMAELDSAALAGSLGGEA